MEKRDPVDERIRELYRKAGIITPDMVIEDAKNPKSPLHDQFNWNVEEAAWSAWRETARRLIRQVRVVVEVTEVSFDPKRQRKEFLPIPNKPPGTQGYIRRAELKTQRERAIEAMNAEIARIESAITRALEVAEDIGLTAEVESVKGAVTTLKDKIPRS
jgi:hypothetical protein